MICGSGGSKSRLAKAAGAEPAGQMRDEKLHAVVARSTFPSQNGQNTRGADHFWKLRCRKSARRCGAKHISKSKCTKHTTFGPLLEVAMSKKCTPLWREAHFQVKMYKTHQCRTTFGSSDVEKVHAVVARSTFPSENAQNTPFSDHFWRLRCRLSKKCTPLWCEAHFQVKMYKAHHVRTTFGGSDVEVRKSARRCGAKHISKSKCTKHTMFGPLLAVQMLLRLTRLHYITLHFAALHITLHYTTLHNTTGYNYNYTTTVHYTTLHYTKLHCTTLSTLHFTTLHDTTLHYTTNTTTPTQLHSTTLHYTTLHYLTLHYTPQHYN